MREDGVCFISADPFAAPGFLATVSFYSLMKYDTWSINTIPNINLQSLIIVLPLGYIWGVKNQ